MGSVSVYIPERVYINALKSAKVHGHDFNLYVESLLQASLKDEKQQTMKNYVFPD